MNSLDDMFEAGLYINDLSMHDSSRDLVLAGTQQSAELKLSLDQEQEKSRLLEQSMQLLDIEMKRTDALLYQMIPKSVADRLRKGEPSGNTCEVFENVTILFSDVVGFTTICSRINPMEVVCLLNAMYTKFDQLSEKHNVYKVETIGDAYMGVSGAPIVNAQHAIYVSNMALDMVNSIIHLIDPSTGGNVQIRIGIHSGAVVAGVVGIKMPRYCLFGETVTTAARMETTGEAMEIHVSEVTKRELADCPYSCDPRGCIDLKGKGIMKTYWLRLKGQSRDVSLNSQTDGCNMLPRTKNPSLSYEGVMRSDVMSTPQLDILAETNYKSFGSSGVHFDPEKYEKPITTRYENSNEPTNTDNIRHDCSHVQAAIPSTTNSRTCCIL